MSAFGNFYNENEFRAYPFLDSQGNPGDLILLPHNVVLDAKFTLVASEADSESSVSLARVVFTPPNQITLTFQVGAFLAEIVWEQSLSGIERRETAYDVIDLSDSGSVTVKNSSGTVAHANTVVEGYVVMGTLADMPHAFGNREGSLALEPGNVVLPPAPSVLSVSVGNKNRTRATYPIYCEGDATGAKESDKSIENPLKWPSGMNPDAAYWMQHQDLGTMLFSQEFLDSLRIISGKPLVLREGHNCRLEFSSIANSISVIPTLNGGMGPVASDISLGSYVAGNQIVKEKPPAERYRLDGAVRLQDTVRLIQDATGPLTAVQGLGVITVTAMGESGLFVSSTGVKTTDGFECGG